MRSWFNILFGQSITPATLLAMTVALCVNARESRNMVDAAQRTLAVLSGSGQGLSSRQQLSNVAQQGSAPSDSTGATVLHSPYAKVSRRASRLVRRAADRSRSPPEELHC